MRSASRDFPDPEGPARTITCARTGLFLQWLQRCADQPPTGVPSVIGCRGAAVPARQAGLLEGGHLVDPGLVGTAHDRQRDASRRPAPASPGTASSRATTGPASPSSRSVTTPPVLASRRRTSAPSRSSSRRPRRARPSRLTRAGGERALDGRRLPLPVAAVGVGPRRRRRRARRTRRRRSRAADPGLVGGGRPGRRTTRARPRRRRRSPAARRRAGPGRVARAAGEAGVLDVDGRSQVGPVLVEVVGDLGPRPRRRRRASSGLGLAPRRRPRRSGSVPPRVSTARDLRRSRRSRRPATSPGARAAAHLLEPSRRPRPRRRTSCARSPARRLHLPVAAVARLAAPTAGSGATHGSAHTAWARVRSTSSA